MDAACRVKSDRGYTVAALDNLEEEFGLLFFLASPYQCVEKNIVTCADTTKTWF
jgi:hypothetical protein